MYLQEFFAILCYLTALTVVGVLSYRKHQSATSFIIGNRSLNYWLTALAAHASDMSSWLFIGYPAVVFTGGVFSAWAAIGLIVFMWLNWQLIAPKVRVATEQYNALTFSSFFESRLADTSGLIRICTALMSLVFYTIYISSGLVGLGLLLETLFNIPFDLGILIGIFVVIPYVFMGGYVTLAWIDLFQGFFLMGVIIAVPIYICSVLGGIDVTVKKLTELQLPLSLLPSYDLSTWGTLLSMLAGWGLGYFGQPHIVTKFMGIRHVHEIYKSKYIGMTWMVLALTAATFVGLVGVAYFHGTLADPEHVFITMVRDAFHPFLVGLILCAVLAATINAMSSQVLVLSSSIAEDFYKRVFRKDASSKELLLVSRLGILLVACIAFLIAYAKISSIYSLVLYAWSGLGSSFGPLLLLSLYWKRLNKYGAWAGILSGGIIAGIWPYFSKVPAMLPAFTTSFFLIIIISIVTRHKGAPHNEKTKNFNHK